MRHQRVLKSDTLDKIPRRFSSPHRVSDVVLYLLYAQLFLNVSSFLNFLIEVSKNCCGFYKKIKKHKKTFAK